MTAERRLVSLRRRVPAERDPTYRTLWATLVAAVTPLEAHAWRFVSPEDPELHLEFLEFRASADPRAAGDVRDLLARMESEAGDSITEEWLQSE